MLKTLSLTPEEGGDETADAHASESRMLRALNALSSQAPEPAGGTPGRSEQRSDGGGFRQNRGQSREMPRNDSGGAAFARARHRFVKDGEVPVVHMPVPRARDAVAPAPNRNDPEIIRLQQALDDQRLKLEQADRARQEAQNQLRQLQTKFAHIEMSLNDATALAESRQLEIASLQAELRERDEQVVPEAAEDTVALAPRRVGRPRTRPLEPMDTTEPEPVQWWLTPASAPKRPRRNAEPG